jgi:hypothetical protein
LSGILFDAGFLSLLCKIYALPVHVLGEDLRDSCLTGIANLSSRTVHKYESNLIIDTCQIALQRTNSDFFNEAIFNSIDSVFSAIHLLSVKRKFCQKLVK